MTLSRQKRRARCLRTQHCVQCASGAVQQARTAPEKLSKGLPMALRGYHQNIHNPLDRIARRGGALKEGQSPGLILHDQIGECPAGVDSQPKTVHRFTAGCAASEDLRMTSGKLG